MGVLDINIGELVNRFVRAFNVRGRVPLSLDDQVLPTILAYDATRSPFRQGERAFFRCETVAAVAAQQSFLVVHNRTGQAVVLDYLNLRGAAGAGTISFLIRGESRGAPTANLAVTGESYGANVDPTNPATYEKYGGLSFESGQTAVPILAQAYDYLRPLFGAATLQYTIDNAQITIPNGGDLTIAVDQANTGFTASMRFRGVL